MKMFHSGIPIPKMMRWSISIYIFVKENLWYWWGVLVAERQQLSALSIVLCRKFFEGKLEGKVYIDGQDTSDLDIQDLAGIVGSVFQDPRSQFFATDTTAEIAFSCENVGLPREELCRRIEKAANDLQINRLLERSIF